LLRPELVRHYAVPLSSDAFTLFGKRGAGIHNKEVLKEEEKKKKQRGCYLCKNQVREATEFLLNQRIPHFAAILDFQEDPGRSHMHKHPKRYRIKITDERLPEIIHREVLNISI